ncbi:MAG: glycosyltransferase family 2 protein [Bryobacterales bacterium]|nr:glycosyltransferase family 2 protein [Bryobacterales bacterium]
MASRETVCVSIVTFNSATYIERCLQAVLDQRDVLLDVVVIDNGSTDETRRILTAFGDRIRVFENEVNSGFAAGQNQAIRESTADWVLALNPDVLLEPHFISRLIQAAHRQRRVGTVCGKLLAIGPGFEPLPDRLLDSTGIILTPALRHLDRGWHEPDRGQYDAREYVFGASGAAALYRRTMIEDVSWNGEFFDEAFFCYREDADLAWRAQLQGWRCLYVPEAEAHHVRRVTPEVRRHLPPVLNMHSVKNRFLMRIKNTTAEVYRLHWWNITMRDIAVIGCCLVWEVRSLPAFWRLIKELPAALRKRAQIMAKRRVDDEHIASWFEPEHKEPAKPVTKPAIAIRRAS